YQYTPLHHPESIRLLTLLYGEFSSPIHVRLAEVRLSKKPQYEALSYSWATEGGDTSLSSQIVCDEGKTLAVTKNCELALRYIRKGDSLTTLWVDAICINQQDIKERGHQVGIMRNVYANATKVLVWLGEGSE
ncbi:HET-domain-containing protein, partial [Hyaloscypha variabilis F]